MTYRVTGAGMIPKLSEFATLAQAADLARRMTDEGVENVFVFDPLGREMSPETLARD